MLTKFWLLHFAVTLDWLKSNMNTKYTKYTVAVALRSKDSLWLSQRINTANFQGKWQCAGGKLEKDENPLDGGLRELKEETNLEIDRVRVRFCGQVNDDPTTKTCFIYYIDLNESEIPVRTENKNTDWVLLPYDEALKLDLMPGLIETIGKLRKIDREDAIKSLVNLTNETGCFSVDTEIPAPTWKEPLREDYSRFINEVTGNEDSGTNGLTFDKLSKKYGSAYLQCVYSAYSCLGGSMTDEEFCQYWGDIPKGFFDKKIKHVTTFKKLN